jgi:hypothetical protein
MLPVSLALLAWLPALVGLGALVRCDGDPGLRRAVSGLLGLGVATFAATALHFVAPVGPLAALGLWLVGLIALAARRTWLLEGLAWSELVGVLVAVPWCLHWLQDPGRNVDSGLYYLQTVRWTTERPLALGLANLHGRLGFNSAWHVLAAALELPWLVGRSASFVNLLPMALVAGAGATGLGRIASGRRRFGDFALALLLPVVGQAVGGLGAASADQAVSILLGVAFVLWIQALEGDGAGVAAAARAACLLTVLAVTVKLSAAPALLLCAGALVVRRRDLDRRWLAVTALLGAGLVAPWLARSLLLSGCLVYPLPASCAPGLPWAVPLEAVQAELDWARSWARAPDLPPAVVLADWRWLGRWSADMANRGELHLFGATAAVGLGLTLGLALAAGALGPGRAGRPPAALLLPLAAALLGVANVFLSAPDPRFGLGYLHALGLVPLAFGLSRLGAPRRPAASSAATTAWPVVGRAVVVLAIVALAGRWAKVSSHSRWTGAWLEFPEPPAARTVERVTASGLRVNVPVEGGTCWAAPLPCMQYFDPALRQAGRTFSRDR